MGQNSSLSSPTFSGSSKATLFIREDQMTQNEMNRIWQEAERIYKNICEVYLWMEINFAKNLFQAFLESFSLACVEYIAENSSGLSLSCW